MPAPSPTRLATRVRYLRYNSRLRRALLWAVGGLALLGALWIVATGFLARQQLREIEHTLAQAQASVAAGDLQRARALAGDLPAQAARAHRLTSGPAWWIAAHAPYLGAPLKSVRGMTAAGVRLGRDGLPELLDVARRLDPARVRASGNTLDLAAIAAAAPDLDRASAVLGEVSQVVDALPSTTWLGAVDTPRRALAARLRSLTGYVEAARRAARILPTMLGGQRPQRYFVAMQNEAELRGTGGLPGAFAIVVADHGSVRFTHFGSDSELQPADTNHLIRTGLRFGDGYHDAYGASLPTASILNSNVSPSFPHAARIWARMWQLHSGQHVDGAIAVDPAVLAGILRATGPVRLADGQAVSARNVVALTESDEYTMFSDNAQRKAFLVGVLKASSQALLSGRGSAVALARAMVAASEQQRLQVWSADAGAQAELAQTSYGAVIGPTKRPLVAPVLNNTSGGKLDYYLTRALAYHRSGCGASRDVLVTLTLANNAPASGLPPYVTDRFDTDRPADSKPGDYSTLLDYYATKGAELLSVRVDGTPATAAAFVVDGQPMFRLSVQLPRGQTRTVELHLQEPPGDGAPKIWAQPGVTPMAVTAYSQPCG